MRLAHVNLPLHLESVDAITKKLSVLGFFMRTYLPLIALATSVSLSLLTVWMLFLAHSLAKSVAGVEATIPRFLDLTLIKLFKAVVDKLGENGIMHSW